MKSNRPFIFIVGFFVLSLSVFAQTPVKDEAFKVLVNKGKNEVKASGGSWQLIKTGSVLKTGDEVKLVDNAYLGLIHKTGKPLELKLAGSYKVVDLANKVSQGSSVINKYTDFILSANTEKKNKLSATGAVHRGVNMLKVYLPKSESSVMYGNELILDWEKKEGVKAYVVNMQSLLGDDLYSTETTEKTIPINLNDAKFANEDNIIIEVYPKGEPGKKADPPYIIKRLSAADKNRIKTSLNEIAEYTKEETPLNKLILAGFFEQNKLYIDASTAYQQAIKLAPDVQQYQDDYHNFLLRNGLKEEKKAK
jgi:hypothetical protein